MIGKIVAFKPRSKGGGNQLAYLAGEALNPVFTDYHSKNALGVWQLGSGLSALGLPLEGGFDPQATSRLAEGFHAITGEPLSRNSGADHRQGWDITIDDPKDFSLIHAFGTEAQKQDYYQARQEAWKVVVSEIERLARPKYAGKEGPVKIAMQIFEHDDSRSGDPHKHGHGFLFNVGVLPDGSTCAIDAGPIMRSKAYLGQLYQSELARQYALKGRAVVFEDRESTDTKTKTRYAVATIPDLVTAEQRAGFSERSAAIAEALEKTGANKSVNAKNAAALSTRSEKSLTHAEMVELWNAKAQDLGLNITNFHSALEADAVPTEKAEVARARMIQEISELSTQAIDGNGIFGEHEIAFAAARALRGHSLEHIRKAIDTLEKQFVPVQSDNGFGRQFTTKACITLEKTMVRNFKFMAIAKALTLIDLETCKRSESLWETKTGHRLTDEQRAATRHIVCGQNMLANIEGEAGTGKSTLMEVAADAWKSQGLRVLGAAPTGKAAEALAMSIGEADTCARLLMDIDSGRQKLDAKTVLVIDECGMLASPPYAKLVEHAKQAGAKLVCVGDRSQLAAIGMRGGFQAAIEAAGKADITENRRQSNAKAVGGHIGKLFRQGKSSEALDLIEQEGRLSVEANPENIVDAVAKRWIADTSNPMGKMVLAELTDTVSDLNEAIRSARKNAGQLGEDFKGELTTRDGGKFKQDLAIGEKIIFLQNAGKDSAICNLETGRPAKPKNGTAAMIENIQTTLDGSLFITARTEDGKLLRWQTADYSTFALGYAHSYHKSQGSTATNVYAVAEGSQVADLGLAYVGATRHKNDCHMFVTEESRSRWAQRASIRADARMLSEKLLVIPANIPQIIIPTIPVANSSLLSITTLDPIIQPNIGQAPILSEKRKLELGQNFYKKVEARRVEVENINASCKPGSHAKSKVHYRYDSEITSNDRLQMELAKAATRGDISRIYEELDKGAQVDGLCQNVTALHRAATVGRASSIDALTRAGANLNYLTNRGLTALHIAAGKGHSEVCIELLAAGADFQIVDKQGRKAYELAETMGYIELANEMKFAELEIQRVADEKITRGKSKTAASAIKFPIPRPPRPTWEQELTR